MIAIVHALYDIWAFAVNVDDLSDWVTVAELAVSAAIAVWSVIILRHRSEDASALWRRKWNQEGGTYE